MKNEKTCASFLKRKEKRKYYVPYADIWRICTLHFACCINLNDLDFVVSYFTYFPFCIFPVWSGKSLNGKLLDGVKFCLPSAISLRWHAQYLCAQLFGLKAGNAFDVCRCVHLHCALCSVHCALCTVSDVCTAQSAATPLARCHKDTKGTTPTLSQRCKRSFFQVNMYATCTAVQVGLISSRLGPGYIAI